MAVGVRPPFLFGKHKNTIVGLTPHPLDINVKERIMEDLIEALNIFLKYKNAEWPTHCEHDVLWVVGITKEEVTETDRLRLDELGFFFAEDEDSWQSFRYGSA